MHRLLIAFLGLATGVILSVLFDIFSGAEKPKKRRGVIVPVLLILCMVMVFYVLVSISLTLIQPADVF